MHTDMCISPPNYTQRHKSPQTSHNVRQKPLPHARALCRHIYITFAHIHIYQANARQIYASPQSSNKAFWSPPPPVSA